MASISECLMLAIGINLMTKEYFQSYNPNFKTVILINTANDIIDEYQQQGYVLTLRQLYYQFVARDVIENSLRSYKNLGSVITKARLAGLISWTAIEDRNRNHNRFWTEEDDQKVIDDLSYSIRFDRWERQPSYVEVWVEKEALGNVISRACNPYLIPNLACKGYLSASEAWRAGKRFERKLDEGKNCVLIHLGDHDPSGIDMTRDNQDRIDLFTRFPDGVDVKRIALNMDQVDQYSPPPNPTKITDSRAKEYIARHGHVSWELDALEPSILENLIKDTVDPLIDWDLWDETIAEQNHIKKLLGKLGNEWPDLREKYQKEIDDE